MTEWDLAEAFGKADDRYIRKTARFLSRQPIWRCVMKKSIKFAVTAAAAVLTVGVIAVAMLLQSGPEAGVPAAGSSGLSQKKTVHVVTNLGKNWQTCTGIEGDEISAQYAMERALAYFGGLPDGVEVEVEVLPTDDADLQSRLTRIKTEIMSGGGPDVFVMSCCSTWGKQEWLFNSPKKAMLDGYFLPLDDYIENAQIMEWDKLTPAIMEAGAIEGRQFVLPMFYSYGAAKATEIVPVEDLPDSWEKVKSCENEIVQKGYGMAASCAFYDVLGEIVDYEKEELTVSEEEIYTRLMEALSLYEMSDSLPVRGINMETPLMDPDVYGENSPFGETPFWSVEDGETATYFPFRDMEGEVNATVTAYAAINNNTQCAEEAFTVLEVLLSRQFQSGERFWNGGTNDGAAPVFSAAYGVPVHEELLQRNRPVNYFCYIDDDVFPAYCALRDQITTARFFSNVDDTLNQLYWNCWKVEMSDAAEETKDDTIRDMVSKAYAAISMMLGES